MSKFPENSEMRTSVKFSERIKDLIEDNDCKSNKQFAKYVGVSYPIITKAVDFGIIPTTTTLIKIADKLDISLSYLLGVTNENEFIGTPTPTTFHTRIQDLAKERNETLGGIAENMPFSRTYFYLWIKNNTLPMIEFAIAIAEYFDVSLDYLFGRTDYRK